MPSPLRRVIPSLLLLAAGLAASEADAEEATDVATYARMQSASSPVDRQIAQYEVAVGLYRRGLVHASYAIFSEITSHADHTRYEQSFVWIERIAETLPEPSDVMEHIGFDEDAISRVAAREPRAGAHLWFLLGRYAYRNRRYEVATRILEKVDRSSPFWSKAQLLMGTAHILDRCVASATRAFQRVADQ